MRNCSVRVSLNSVYQGFAALGKWSRKCYTAHSLQTLVNPKAVEDFITQLGQAHLNKYIGFYRGKKKIKMRVREKQQTMDKNERWQKDRE